MDEDGRAARVPVRRSAETNVKSAVCAILLALAGCSAPPEDPATVTGDEESQLNAAAAMLDANSVDADADASNESAP